MTRPLLIGPLPRDIAEMSGSDLHREASRARDAVTTASSARGLSLYVRLSWLEEAVRRWYVGGAEVSA